jgi:hypothetical protein
VAHVIPVLGARKIPVQVAHLTLGIDADGQRFPQQAVEDAEGRGIRPDPEPQGKNRREGEGWVFPHGADGITQIAHEVVMILPVPDCENVRRPGEVHEEGLDFAERPKESPGRTRTGPFFQLVTGSQAKHFLL